MSDPAFDIKVYAAFGADPDSDLSAAVWTELTATYGRVRPIVDLKVGRHSMAGQSDPLEIHIRIGNNDGWLTPFNEASPYYPHVVRNLPIMVKAAAFGDTPVELATGFMSDIRMDWTGPEICTAILTARGRLYRLQRSAVPKASSADTTIVTSSPVAYWPLTDGPSATQAASGLPGGPPMVKSGYIKFGTGDGGPGQPNILDLGALHNKTGSLTALVPAGTSSTSWRMEARVNWRNMTPTDDGIGIQWETAGTIKGWQIVYRHSDERIVLRYTPDGGSPVDLNTSKLEPYDGVTRSYRVTADQNGTGVDVTMTIDGVNVLTSTIASQTLGRPTTAKLRTAYFFDSGYDGSQSPAVGHYTFWAPFSSSADTGAAATGYAAESASDRIARLCDEASVPVVVHAGETSLMGVQPEGKLMELLRECEAADAGLLYDGGPSGALVYLPRSARYNLQPAIALAGSEISNGFSAVLDDTDLATDVTVSQPDGSSGQFMTTGDEGVYPKSFTLNLDDSEPLEQHAAWRSAITTVPAMRYEQVPIDFLRDPRLLDLWLADGGVGCRITITDLPEQHSAEPVDQIVEGYTAVIDAVSWVVVLDCVPAQPYEVAVLDTTTSTLQAAVSASDTTFTSVISAPPLWSMNEAQISLKVDAEDGIVATTVTPVPIAAVAAGAASHADNASVVPALYAGNAANDMIFVLAAIRGNSAQITTPTDYVRLCGWNNFALFAKLHDGTEAAPTVAFTGGAAGDTTSAFTFGFRNTILDASECLIDWSDWLNISQQNIPYPPLIEPLYYGSLILYLGWKADDWTSVATLAGATEIAEPFTTTGNDQGLVADYLIQTTPAAVASGSFTVTGGTSQASRGMIVVIGAGRQTLTVTRPTDGSATTHAAGASIQAADRVHLGL